MEEHMKEIFVRTYKTNGSCTKYKHGSGFIEGDMVEGELHNNSIHCDNNNVWILGAAYRRANLIETHMFKHRGVVNVEDMHIAMPTENFYGTVRIPNAEAHDQYKEILYAFYNNIRITTPEITYPLYKGFSIGSDIDSAHRGVNPMYNGLVFENVEELLEFMCKMYIKIHSSSIISPVEPMQLYDPPGTERRREKVGTYESGVTGVTDLADELIASRHRSMTLYGTVGSEEQNELITINKPSKHLKL